MKEIHAALQNKSEISLLYTKTLKHHYSDLISILEDIAANKETYVNQDPKAFNKFINALYLKKDITIKEFLTKNFSDYLRDKQKSEGIEINDSEFNCNAAHIVNLDRSVERWENIIKQLQKVKQPYQRFKAIDGYDILFQNVQTNQTFTGVDVRNNRHLVLNKNSLYKINCTNGQENPVIFHYQGAPLSAGEYGVYCSHISIWQQAQKYQCKNSIIFEDDIRVKNSHLPSKLSKSLESLPEYYDIFLLDRKQVITYGRKLSYIDDKKDISKLENTDRFYGGHAYIISNHGIDKLMSTSVFTEAIDIFLSEYYPKTLYQLNIYMYLDNVVDHSNGISEIHEMGRSH